MSKFIIPLIVFLGLLGFYFNRFYLQAPNDYHKPVPECVVQKIFTDLGNSSKETYQAVALNQLNDKSPKDYRYYFKTFLEEGSDTYMLTNFRNGTECFDVKVFVDKWDKLAGMKRTNGNSYPNELFDLKWKLQAKSGKKKVVYLDMHRIID